jgi:hypothetical protein
LLQPTDKAPDFWMPGPTESFSVVSEVCVQPGFSL